MNLLSPLPVWVKPVAIGIVLLMLATAAWVNGYLRGAQKLLDYQAAQIKEGERIGKLQIKVTEKVVTEYLTSTIKIKEKGDEIVHQIPFYITQRIDSACFVNNGARVVHDSAARNEIPPSPGPDNEESSGLKLSTVLSTVAANYATYHEIAARLTACQDWIAAQFEVINGEKYVWPK